MGEIEGVKGAWGYVEGGMGSVSRAIADCASDHGASIFTDKVNILASTLYFGTFVYEQNPPLTLCILMDYSFWFDTINLG